MEWPEKHRGFSVHHTIAENMPVYVFLKVDLIAFGSSRFNSAAIWNSQPTQTCLTTCSEGTGPVFIQTNIL